MAKPKHALALFEVMRKGKSPASQPATAPAQAKPDPSVTTPDAGAKREEPARETTAPGPEKAPPPVGADKASGETGGRPVQIDGGVIRIRLALSSTQTAFVIFVLVALLVIVFAIGHKVGFSGGQAAGFAKARALGEEAPDELQLALQQNPIREDVFEGIGPSPILPAEEPEPKRRVSRPIKTEVPPPAPSGDWVKGLTYICVQEFMSDARADALATQQYLRQHGVETALVDNKTGSWRYRLVTRQGFNRDDPQQRKAADAALQRVRQIGDRYFSSGGRYRLEGYFVKLTRDRW